MNVAIIGGGVMGEAILAAGLRSGTLAPAETVVCEALEARRLQLQATHAVAVTASAEEAAAAADAVILAVKPQDAARVKATLRSDALLISIMAGVRTATLRELFGASRVVRVMPNTPAAVGAGMSAWYALPGLSAGQREFTRSLLASFGRQVEMDDEKKIDMATALSGSGPAYVFLFLEALIEGGVSIGLTRPQAEEMVLQTVYGSALFAMQSDRSAAELRAAVTSPAGTTAVGLLELEKGAFRAALIECVRAAHARAIDLGRPS